MKDRVVKTIALVALGLWCTPTICTPYVDAPNFSPDDKKLVLSMRTAELKKGGVFRAFRPGASYLSRRQTFDLLHRISLRLR